MGVQSDAEIERMLSWPVPNELKILRFLGLTNSYRKFVKGYDKIAALLVDLLKRMLVNEVRFTKGIVKHSEAMTTMQLLAMPQFLLPISNQNRCFRKGRSISYFIQVLSTMAR